MLPLAHIGTSVAIADDAERQFVQGDQFLVGMGMIITYEKMMQKHSLFNATRYCVLNMYSMFDVCSVYSDTSSVSCAYIAYIVYVWRV